MNHNQRLIYCCKAVSVPLKGVHSLVSPSVPAKGCKEDSVSSLALVERVSPISYATGNIRERLISGA